MDLLHLLIIAISCPRLITRRPQVQILSPQPEKTRPYDKNRKAFFVSLRFYPALIPLNMILPSKRVRCLSACRGLRSPRESCLMRIRAFHGFSIDNQQANDCINLAQTFSPSCKRTRLFRKKSLVPFIVRHGNVQCLRRNRL